MGASLRRASCRSVPPRGRCCGPCRRTPRAWNGQTAHQYACPASPCGWKRARCRVHACRPPVGRDPQLQPGQARQPHLRAQPQQTARADLLHPPEVQRVPDPQPSRVPAAAAQPHPADQPVQPARAPPRPAGRNTSRAPRRCPRRPATAPPARRPRAVRAGPCTGCRPPSPGRSAAGRSVRPAPTPTTSGWPPARPGCAASASSSAWSNADRPPGGSGTYRGDVVLPAHHLVPQ